VKVLLSHERGRTEEKRREEKAERGMDAMVIE